MPFVITSRGGARRKVRWQSEIELVLHDGNYLVPPGAVTTGSGAPYKIYTPFAKALLAQMPPHDPLPAPTVDSPRRNDWPASDDLRDWNLLPSRPDWSGGIAEFWEVGEEAAADRLEEWAEVVHGYDESRNLPFDRRLLASFTASSLGRVVAGPGLAPARQGRGQGWTTFAKELVWRDYAQNVIAQFPDYATPRVPRGI